jgi:hypothetical protein
LGLRPGSADGAEFETNGGPAAVLATLRAGDELAYREQLARNE